MKSKPVAFVLVISIALASGCAYPVARRTAKIGAGLFAAGALAGLLTLAAGPDLCSLDGRSGGESPLGCLIPLAAVGGLAAGSPMVLFGLLGLVIHEDPAAVEERELAEEREVAARAEEGAEDRAARDSECLQLRVERLRAAGKIADVRLRAQTLLSIPVCITAATLAPEPPPVQP